MKTKRVRSNQKSRLRSLHTTPKPEYDDLDIEQHLSLLRQHFTGIAGMQPTLLGQYVPGLSVPKFTPIPVHEKFVQIMHNYDHWVSVTNVFSADAHDAYVYDSVYSTVSLETIAKLLFKPFCYCDYMIARTILPFTYGIFKIKPVAPDFVVCMAWRQRRPHVSTLMSLAIYLMNMYLFRHFLTAKVGRNQS